ncbi:MAG TPA: hypothetical protein VIM45_03090 [Dehalococcoidia bacterium]
MKHPIRVVSILGFVLLLPLLISACGTNKGSSGPAVSELNKVTSIKRGEPALVFVYTDG